MTINNRFGLTPFKITAPENISLGQFLVLAEYDYYRKNAGSVTHPDGFFFSFTNPGKK